MNNSKKLNRGFTLIELLVVIAIISLLSSVVFSSMSTVRVKAYNSKAISTQAELSRRLGADLAAYYNFEEPSGTSILDVSGYSNTGVVTNAARIIEPDRNSLNFNAVDSNVAFTSSFPTPTNNNELTISALINLDTDSGSQKTIIASDANGSDNYLSITNRRLCLQVTEIADINNQTFCTPNNSIKLNQWTHIATSIKNRDYTISINGSVMAKGTSATNIASWGGYPWFIGKRASFSLLIFSGKIDEVKIFNKADFD